MSRSPCHKGAASSAHVTCAQKYTRQGVRICQNGNEPTSKRKRGPRCACAVLCAQSASDVQNELLQCELSLLSQKRGSHTDGDHPKPKCACPARPTSRPNGTACLEKTGQERHLLQGDPPAAKLRVLSAAYSSIYPKVHASLKQRLLLLLERLRKQRSVHTCSAEIGHSQFRGSKSG